MAKIREWDDPATGLRCLILKHDTLGHLCGYVAVPPEHPFHGISYDEAHDRVSGGVDVHGGLTFEGRSRLADSDQWFFGFDCAHLGDAIPGIDGFEDDGAVYRDEAYVTAECEKLAAQLARAEGRDQ